MLEATIYVLLKKHFRKESYYVDLLELFHDVPPSPFPLHLTPVPSNPVISYTAPQLLFLWWFFSSCYFLIPIPLIDSILLILPLFQVCWPILFLGHLPNRARPTTRSPYCPRRFRRPLQILPPKTLLHSNLQNRLLLLLPPRRIGDVHDGSFVGRRSQAGEGYSHSPRGIFPNSGRKPALLLTHSSPRKSPQYPWVDPLFPKYPLPRKSFLAS